MLPSYPESLLMSDRNRNIVKFALFFLIGIYFIDCFTPLRLHYDSVRYYLIKDCIEIGCPPDSDQAKDYFPYGYTANLLILSKLGILTSFTVVFTNSAFLLGGLYFLGKVFKKTVSPYMLFIVVLLNWLLVKFVTHPLSEMQYIFFSLASVYFFYKFTQERKIPQLLIALLFGWLAFVTRTVGVTLICAIGVGLIWEFKEQQLSFLKKNKILVSLVLMAIVTALIIFSRELGINHYAGVLSRHFKEAPFFTRMGWRFMEWGELFINTPSNKVIDRLLGVTGLVIFIVIGLVIFSWFMYVLFSRKTGIPFFIKAYIIFYCIIMFNWPFNDPRFWVPVMPLMAAIVLHGLHLNKNRIITNVSKFLQVVYILLGLFAAGYMVYSSFNKEFFARNQARGTYRNDYEMYFFGKIQSDTGKFVSPYVMGVLKRYN